MNHNSIGKPNPGGDAARPGYSPPVKQIAKTAPLVQPGLNAPAETPLSPTSTPKVAKDTDATSQGAKKDAEKSSRLISDKLQNADYENRTWDEAFSKFHARAGQADATRRYQERKSSEMALAMENELAKGAEQMGGTGRAMLRADKTKAGELNDELEVHLIEQIEDEVFKEDENGTSERKKMDDLTPEGQKAYQHTAAELMSDPEARLALQSLLLSGKMSGGALDANGKDLLTNLETMAHDGIDPGIDHWQLVADVLVDLANQGRVGEGLHAGPVATALMALATKNPAEYLRLIRGLASISGQVRMANGRPLTRRGRLSPGEGRWRARLLRDAMEEYDDEEDERR